MTKPHIPEDKTIAIDVSGNQGGIRMWPSEDLASRLYDIANVGLIVGLIVGVISTVLIVWMGNVKEAYLKKDLGTTGERAARAIERASTVEAGNIQLRADLTTETGKVAGLERAASDAKAAQQRVETELARQKERTAGAEKAASDAALALARFKQPRSLSPEQQDALITALKPFVGQSFAFAVFPDPEPLALARLLDALLKSAGWNRVPSQIEREGGVLVEAAGESAATIFDSGITAYIAPEDTESVPAQSALCSALVAAAIPCETHRTPQLAGKTPRAITISIGKKP